MMKKTLKIVLIVIVVLGIAFFAFSRWSKSHSPAETVNYSENGLDISVEYSRPYKKEREIFGALVPYGKVWRTGANEATVIEFKQDVKVNDEDLKAGKYSLWTIPRESSWTIIFNEETGQWGTNYDASKDILKIDIPSKNVTETVEQFKIELKDANEPNGADLVLAWENTEVIVPIAKN